MYSRFSSTGVGTWAGLQPNQHIKLPQHIFYYEMRSNLSGLSDFVRNAVHTSFNPGDTRTIAIKVILLTTQHDQYD